MAGNNGGAGRIGVVVVGAGRMGGIHAANCAQDARLELRYIATRHPEATAPTQLASQFPGCKSVDLEAALADARVGLAVVCSSSDTHPEVVTAALAAGKHVLVEKPLALTAEGIERCYAAAAKHQRLLLVGFQRRYDPDFVELQQLVASGALGRPKTLRLTSRDHPPPDTRNLSGGGSFFSDFSIHDLDTARFLLGRDDEVEAAWACGASFLPAYAAAGLDDTAAIVLTTRSGAMVTIDNSRRTCYGYDIRAELHGSRGTAELRNTSRSAVVVKTEGGAQGSPLPYSFPQRFAAAYKAELASMVELILAGAGPDTPSPLMKVTKEDCLAACRLAERCQQARDACCPLPAAAPTAPAHESKRQRREPAFKPLPADKPVGCVVVGAGRMGRVRAEAVRSAEAEGLAKLVAVVDIVPAAVEAMARDFAVDGVVLAGSANGGPDPELEEVLRRGDVAAVFVCTTSDTHAAIILQAARAGVHIFVEKPMTPTAAEAETCVAAVREHGVHLYCGFQRRSDPHFRALYEATAAQAPAEIVRFTARDSAVHNSPEYLLTSGHQVYDSLVHEVDMALWLAGEARPIEVYGCSQSFDPRMKGKEDCVVAVIRFSNGCLALLDNDRCSQYGYVQVGECHTAASTAITDNALSTLTQRLDAAGVCSATALHNGIDRYRPAYAAGARHFLRSLRGEEAPRAQPEANILVNKLCDALIASMASGKPVKL